MGSFGDRSKIMGSFCESVVKRGSFGNRLTNDVYYLFVSVWYD